jgi:hypothetical protein
MLSAETLKAYRQMTVAERLKLTLELTSQAEPWLFYGPPEVIRRRFELLRRQNEERNRRILAGIEHSRGKAS